MIGAGVGQPIVGVIIGTGAGGAAPLIRMSDSTGVRVASADARSARYWM
jgi:hypothetical protein